MISKPYTNSIGQVIQPGDKVVAIAQNRSNRITQRFGTFVGVSDAGNPQVRVTVAGYRRIGPNGNPSYFTEAHHVKDNPAFKPETRIRLSTFSSGRVYKLA